MIETNDSVIKPEDRLNNFQTQINRDIKDIQDEYVRIDPNLVSMDYAFNYWVLLKIFNTEEENVGDFVTDYNDKSVDCYMHFEETKELFIIQCKHFQEDTRVIRTMVADFLKSPLAFLDAGTYKKSKDLQKIYSKAKNDSEYKIYLQFYTTNTNYSDDISTLISDFNKSNVSKKIKAQFFDLKDIYKKYYGEGYKKVTSLKFNLRTINKGTFASIKEEYGINYKYQGYYIITPVEQIYKLLKQSNDTGYSLFEENIREYLGDAGVVNSAIAETLRSEERVNFLYYNNGITVIVKSAKPQVNGVSREIVLENPQIVNGCQTVNTIFSVLDELSEKEIIEQYKDVFVMTKLLIIPTIDDKDKKFYQDVVKYTNKQNPIPDKIFAANNETVFKRIQTELKRYGLWVKVKQSDKIKFDNFTPSDKADMLDCLKKQSAQLGLIVTNKDLCVDLEKILQICLAFITDGYNAFSKKSSVLKSNSEVFKKYSINIQDYLSYENIVRLYLLYKLSERDRKESEDLRTPIPYYVLGFLSYHISDRSNVSCYNNFLNKIFEGQTCSINSIYEYLKQLSSLYKDNSGKEYNVLIKQKIDKQVLDKQIDTARRFMKQVVEFLVSE